jgi:hypothetical protein
VPSASSQATAFSNPPAHSSPPSTSFTRRKTDDINSTPLRRATFSKVDEEGGLADETTGNGDILDTPVREGKGDALSTPMQNRASSKRKTGKVGSSLTLRDQEKVSTRFPLRIPCGGTHFCVCDVSLCHRTYSPEDDDYSLLVSTISSILIA